MSESKGQSGIGFTGLLTVLFVGLKLTGYIDWTWWVVLSPVWIPLVFLLILLFIVGLATVLDD